MLTSKERECHALKKYCSKPLPGMRFLKVMVEETYTTTIVRNSGRDRATSVSVPHKEAQMYALITIHNGCAVIQDLSSNGNLINYRPIPCNGSVSRRAMENALGIHNKRVYAQLVRAVR